MENSTKKGGQEAYKLITEHFASKLNGDSISENPMQRIKDLGYSQALNDVLSLLHKNFMTCDFTNKEKNDFK
jgi:hypothetical protein